MACRVQQADFDVDRELQAFCGGGTQTGAVVSFVGLVRDQLEGDDRIHALSLEHYPGMTERVLANIERQARERWDLEDVLIVHRVGCLQPGDRIVLVMTGSAHRGEAFAACEFLMDHLKTKAPFWKKEDTDSGSHWVEAASSDDQAVNRWQRS